MYDFAELLASERAHLVRLCARLAGNPDAAEDLAQETLIEAWRQQAKLVDWTGYRAWLVAIARFVCLRWRRKHSRESIQHTAYDNADYETHLATNPDHGDLVAEFERHELHVLLDRALALLPEATRTILIQAYVEDYSHSEIAAHLNLSEGAVAMRLQRGKQALEQILTTKLRNDAATFNLVDLAANQTHTLRVLCPFCGVGKVQYISETNGNKVFLCPTCIANGFAPQIVNVLTHSTLPTFKNLKTLLGHSLAMCHEYYRNGLAAQQTLCGHCGSTIMVNVRNDDGFGLHIFCATCNQLDTTPLHYLVLDLPQTRQFWRDHPRMRTLPAQPLTFENQSAVLTRFESVDGRNWINVVSTTDTLDVRLIERSDRLEGTR